MIILAIGLVLMILAPIFAQLIYFAVSRRREYLADASSALYTRYPEGLASALEKLAMSDTHVRTANKATAPMYTADPFQKQGIAADSLMSTHPPIAERIHILRSMAGASLVDYEGAYRQAKGDRSVIPASTLAGAGTVALRAASAEEPIKDKIERTRETSDLMWRLSQYQTVTCANCGTRLRLSPSFRANSVRCPHCGTVNAVYSV